MTGIEMIHSSSGMLYMATITTVGLRLVALARRHRELPELLLGISLLLGGTLGSVLEVAGMSKDAPFDPHVRGALIAAGKACVIGGFACQVFFIRMVFRPREAWAAALVVATICVQVATWAGFAASGTFSSGVMPSPIFLTELASRMTGSAWLVAESIRYYRVMQRRLALGLAEPIVTDRFRLWAVAGLAGLAMLATSAPPVVAYERQAAWMLWMLPLFAVSGIAASSAYLLAFFPPGWYRRRVSARLAAAADAFSAR